MSLALATKGILPDFTGTGTGTGPGETVIEYVEGIIDVEVENEIVTIETKEVEAVIDIELTEPDIIEIELIEDELTEDQIEITLESNEITVEV